MKNRIRNSVGLANPRMRRFLSTLFVIAAFNGSCREMVDPPAGALEVNFEKMQGLWFDIAHLPNGLQEDCENTTILNLPEKANSMSFVYECFRDGWWEAYPGSFTKNIFYPGLMEIHFNGVPDEYWVPSSQWLLAMDPGGTWMVLGEPADSMLWIYARTSQLEPVQLQTIMQKLGQQGDFSEHDLNQQLIFTRHEEDI